MRVRFLSVVLVSACTTSVDAGLSDVDGALQTRSPLGTCGAWGGEVSGVSFTDEQATNAIDFADTATVAELDELFGVGPAIAERIVAARPFAAAVDPLAALDAVVYVGPTILESFRVESEALWCDLDDGRQSCCIELACEGAGATVSDVSFDDAAAHAVLDWANRGTNEQLQAVCQVGPVVAAAIEDARPLHSLLELDLVPFVTPFVLREIAGVGESTCVWQGSVGEEWCGEADAECACE